MDLASMRRDGVDVFIHKATDGPWFYRDPYLAEAMRRARAAGFPVTGSYHVLWNNNPEAQVDWWVDTTLAAAPWAASETFEWLLDCESFSYNGGAPSVTSINRAAARLRQRVPLAAPLAYAPKWVYSSLAGLTCPVVASSYGTNPAVPYRQAYPGDSSSRWAAYGGVPAPAILQYGSRTIVGTQPDVDADAFRGPLTQFIALISTGTPSPIPEGGQVFQVIDNGPDPKTCVISDLSTFTNRHFSWEYLESLHQQGMQRLIVSVGQMGDLLRLPEVPADDIKAAITAQIASLSAANQTAIAALQAAVSSLADALKSAGGDVEAASILDAVKSATDDVKALVEQRHKDEMDALAADSAQRIKALEAELDALRSGNTDTPSTTTA